MFSSRLVTVCNSRTLDSGALVLSLPHKFVGCKLKDIKKHEIAMTSKGTPISDFMMLVSLLKNWWVDHRNKYRQAYLHSLGKETKLQTVPARLQSRSTKVNVWTPAALLHNRLLNARAYYNMVLFLCNYDPIPHHCVTHLPVNMLSSTIHGPRSSRRSHGTKLLCCDRAIDTISPGTSWSVDTGRHRRFR